MTRTVHALVSHDGRYLGAAPPFAVASLWWPEVEPIVAHLDAELGAPAAVLRLLHVADPDGGRGGTVTYHVEVGEPPRDGVLDPAPRDDWAAITAPHPLRADWAEPGGPSELVEWATAALGAPLAGRAVQVKSWNLSCIYRLPTDGGPVWAKAVGRFMTREAPVIDLVARYDRALVPRVLAADRHRSLFADVPGVDCFQTDAATIRAVVPRWVAVQAAAADDAALGELPARPPTDLAGRLAELVERRLPDDGPARRLVDAVSGLAADLGAAGLPGTLVHGDFHPGNWRSDGTARRILDWGDCYVGHPAADVRRLIDWLPADQGTVAARAWVEAWRAARPASRPELALAPMTVLSHVIGALLYQSFLDNIEPDERIYHENDPVTEIRAALSALPAD